jgi:hypothetical protein
MASPFTGILGTGIGTLTIGTGTGTRGRACALSLLVSPKSSLTGILGTGIGAGICIRPVMSAVFFKVQKVQPLEILLLK